MTKNIRLLLLGFGSVNQNLARIFSEKRELLHSRHKVLAVIVGVSDSKGCIMCNDGISIDALLEAKRQKLSVETLAGANGIIKVGSSLELAQMSDYTVLVDGTPCALNPGQDCAIVAFKRNRHVVFANKSPVVHSFLELQRHASENGAGMAYSATFCGGLPVVNICKNDLLGARVTKIEGIFNSTTNYILHEMGRGETFSAALKTAQTLGIAEADPSLDIDGWDTANKLVIISNTILSADGQTVTLDQVSVEGIRGVESTAIDAAREAGDTYKLIATADFSNGPEAVLSVEPRRVPAGEFLGSINGWEMGLIIQSDLYETIWLKIDEPSVVPTASAVLRDIINLSVLNPNRS